MTEIGKRIRLERIFNRKTGRTVIAPMDHGVSSGPIKGIINMDETVESISQGWAKVTYFGTTGYVSLDYLNVMTGENPSNRNDSVSSKGEAVAELAKKFLGTPYRYGGSSPAGFDCSGFVYYIYKNMGVTLNRVAADQMTNGTWVPKNALQPGDIVGFANRSGYINHVGIYVGNGMMIHSPQTGEFVRYESIVTGNYANRLTCGRRIF